MTLKDYLHKKNISMQSFAKKVKISRQMVHNYTNGKYPSLKVAWRIEQITEGQVTMYDWVKTIDKNVQTLDDLY